MGRLERVGSQLVCSRCSAAYGLNERYGFPLLTPRTPEERQQDRYEDARNRHAERYAGLWAFGYHFLQRGEAEGFYRTLNELVCTTPLRDRGNHRILEIGCGVGRSACDAARHYPNAVVIATDVSQRMLEQAYRLLIGDPPGGEVEVPLEVEGWGTVFARSFDLANVFLAMADAMALPFASDQFDVVISANVIDRFPEPERMMREAARVLRPGGYLVLADPFNWSKLPDWWDRCRTLDQLTQLLARHGFQVDVAFDQLVYRELADIRGAYSDWPVAVARAIKRE